MFRYGASLYGNVIWKDVTMPTLFISLSWASCLKTELKVLEMTTSLMMLIEDQPNDADDQPEGIGDDEDHDDQPDDQDQQSWQDVPDVL